MNEYYGKLAGEGDALSAFGLAHGTPRPPPPWAQEWLDGARKNGTKSLTIPSMREKRAFDPLTFGALGMGAKSLLAHAAIGGGVSHIAGNLLQKGVKKVFPQMASHQMASGMRHGLEGRTMHPVLERLISRGLGAESLAPYQAGLELSKKTVGMTPAQRQSFLRSGTNLLKETKYISKAPIAGDIPNAVAIAAKKPGLFHRFMPTAAAGTKFENLPAWQRAIPTAAGVPLIIAEPGMAGHFGINKFREFLSRKVGKKFVANEVAQGARGIPHPEWRKQLMELGLSPATTHPREIGLAMHKEYGGAHDAINRWAAEHGHGPVPLPGAASVADFAKGVYDRVQKPTPAAPAAPVTPEGAGYNGALGKMLLAGGELYALNRAMSRNEDDEQQRRRY